MLEPETNCFLLASLGRLQGATTLKALSELGLIEAQTIPILKKPLRLLLTCWIPHLVFWIRTASGLSQWVYHSSD